MGKSKKKKTYRSGASPPPPPDNPDPSSPEPRAAAAAGAAAAAAEPEDGNVLLQASNNIKEEIEMLEAQITTVQAKMEDSALVLVPTEADEEKMLLLTQKCAAAKLENQENMEAEHAKFIAKKPKPQAGKPSPAGEKAIEAEFKKLWLPREEAFFAVHLAPHERQLSKMEKRIANQKTLDDQLAELWSSLSAARAALTRISLTAVAGDTADGSDPDGDGDDDGEGFTAKINAGNQSGEKSRKIPPPKKRAREPPSEEPSDSDSEDESSAFSKGKAAEGAPDDAALAAIIAANGGRKPDDAILKLVADLQGKKEELAVFTKEKGGKKFTKSHIEQQNKKQEEKKHKPFDISAGAYENPFTNTKLPAGLFNNLNSESFRAQLSETIKDSKFPELFASSLLGKRKNELDPGYATIYSWLLSTGTLRAMGSGGAPSAAQEFIDVFKTSFQPKNIAKCPDAFKDAVSEFEDQCVTPRGGRHRPPVGREVGVSQQGGWFSGRLGRPVAFPGRLC